MDRKTIGEKVLEHLAIQGQIEGVKREGYELSDTISSNEAEIKRLKALEVATTELKTRKTSTAKKLEGLEKELKGLTEELKANSVSVPIVSEEAPPTHIKF